MAFSWPQVDDPQIQLGQVLGRGGEGEALLLAGAGVAVGVPVALGIVRVIRSYLFGVSPYDPVTLLTAIVLLIAVAMLAAWLPARRAARIDPMEALRYE